MKGVVNSLEADGYVSKASVTLSYWELTEEGEGVKGEGSPEARCFEAIKAKPMTKQELEGAVGKVRGLEAHDFHLSSSSSSLSFIPLLLSCNFTDTLHESFPLHKLTHTYPPTHTHTHTHKHTLT